MQGMTLCRLPINVHSLAAIFMLSDSCKFPEAALSLPWIWWKRFLKMSVNSKLTILTSCRHVDTFLKKFCNLGHAIYWSVLCLKGT